jgi:hypothetical protein
MRFVIAERRLQAPQADGQAAEMAARFAATEARGSRLYQREEARFSLDVEDQPVTALRLAIGNWSVQRAPEDACILLRAALAAGQPAAVQPVLAFITQTGLRNPQIDALAARAKKKLRTAGLP